MLRRCQVHAVLDDGQVVQQWRSTADGPWVPYEDAAFYADEADALAKENARLKAWVLDLQSGMYVNCVYCGHRYGPGETTPVSMADALKAHIEQCPEHPMSKMKQDLDAYEKDSADATKTVQDFAEMVVACEAVAVRDIGLKPGDVGWSTAYPLIDELRKRYERLLNDPGGRDD